jgi:hypothetical protein
MTEELNEEEVLRKVKERIGEEFGGLIGLYTDWVFGREEFLELIRERLNDQEMVEKLDKVLESREVNRRKMSWFGRTFEHEYMKLWQEISPSYRKLPVDYPYPIWSGRKDFNEKNLLNDRYVSISNSPDTEYATIPSSKHEDILIKIEEDMYNLDRYISLVKSIISHLQSHPNYPLHQPLLSYYLSLYPNPPSDPISSLTTYLSSLLSKKSLLQPQWTSTLWSHYYRSLDFTSFAFKRTEKLPSQKNFLSHLKSFPPSPHPHFHLPLPPRSPLLIAYKIVSAKVKTAKGDGGRMRLWTEWGSIFLSSSAPSREFYINSDVLAGEAKNIWYYRRRLQGGWGFWEEHRGMLEWGKEEGRAKVEREGSWRVIEGSKGFFEPEFEKEDVLLFGTKWFYLLMRMFLEAAEKVREIMELVKMKVEDDLEGYIGNKDDVWILKGVKERLVEERLLLVIGILYSIMKTPKDIELYESSLISLLGSKAYTILSLESLIKNIVKVIISITNEKISKEIWSLFKEYESQADYFAEEEYLSNFKLSLMNTSNPDPSIRILYKPKEGVVYMHGFYFKPMDSRIYPQLHHYIDSYIEHNEYLLDYFDPDYCYLFKIGEKKSHNGYTLVPSRKVILNRNLVNLKNKKVKKLIMKSIEEGHQQNSLVHTFSKN